MDGVITPELAHGQAIGGMVGGNGRRYHRGRPHRGGLSGGLPNNVAIDTNACGSDPGDSAVNIAKQIAAEVDRQ
jgi:hypothetical protein